MTEFRVSGKSDVDAGEAGDGRCEEPMDGAMERAIPPESIATETAGAAIFEPMGRDEKVKWRRSSEAPAAPSDWMSRMERTIWLLTQELMQPNQTVRHLVNHLLARASRKDAQWQAMMAWMQQRHQK
jgi:hypothetical protein